jgi:hypothetical protein
MACTNSTVPENRIVGPSQSPTPPAQAMVAPTPSSTDDARGAWYVVWDRSSTGWKPPTFNGIVVLADDSVALTFRESSAAYTLDRVAVDGSNFLVDAAVPPREPPADASDEVKAKYAVSGDVLIRGFVEGDELLGYMRWTASDPTRSVDWVPFTGKRALLTNPPNAMPRTQSTP